MHSYMNLANPFDIGIAVIFAFFLIRGIFRGFIKELFSLAGVLGGFYAACTYYLTAAAFLSRWVPRMPYLNMVAFLIIFFGVFILFSILGVGAKYLLNIVFLGWVDRFCGLLFGAAKGVLVVSILLMALTTFLPECDAMIKSSRLSPRVMRISEKIVEIIPTTMKREFNAKLEECKKAWKIKQ